MGALASLRRLHANTKHMIGLTKSALVIQVRICCTTTAQQPYHACQAKQAAHPLHHEEPFVLIMQDGHGCLSGNSSRACRADVGKTNARS